MDGTDIWIPIVGILSSTVMVVLVVFFVTSARQRRAEAQVQMQSRLIDRFGTAPELIEFLHSPAGREFVGGVNAAPALVTRDRIMAGFNRSVILTALGLAFVYLRYVEDLHGFGVPAAILFFLGIGYFAATIVSYKLSQKLLGGGADLGVRS